MERRNQNVERVELTTLVDICIQGDEGTPFQAESANVSGRGMQVRTSYLPEIGDELVCRFEHASREILVEGRVAWRAEGEDSGEFGIQFTALDASSAEVLRNLRAQRAVASPSPVASRLFSLDNEPEDDAWLNSGDKVRLHIEGLAAPMKASVHDGGERKVRVGSSLEFLKVGRALEIEDLRGGRTRGAQVDSVNVVLNPSTSVPELVVMLRYEGASPTPPPAHARTTSARAAAPSAEREQDDDWSDVDEDETFEEAPSLLPERFRPAAEALKVRLGEVFGSVKSVAGQAGGVMGRSFGQASAGMKRLSARKPARRSTSAAPRSSAPRRTTAPPAHRRSSLADAGVVSRDRVDSRASLRPQAASIPAEAPLGSAERTRRLAAIGALAVVILGGSAALLRSRGEGDVPALAATTTNTAGTSPGAPGAAAPTAGAPGTVAAVPAANSAVASAPGAVVAEVPLFGPRALSTSETASAPASDMSDAQAEKLAAAAAVDDEAFEEEAPPAPTPAVEVAPWGRGKLHLPTIHRVRLDAAGTEIAGAADAKGFTVVIPGRKALESGRAIEKRDRRIAMAKASNTARGASIRFEFAGTVPGYRVRLKKDYVEFLISAPEEVAAR